jgi:hypothetical protein
MTLVCKKISNTEYTAAGPVDKENCDVRPRAGKIVDAGGGAVYNRVVFPR